MWLGMYGALISEEVTMNKNKPIVYCLHLHFDFELSEVQFVLCPFPFPFPFPILQFRIVESKNS